jgi:hypothetical protein
LESASVVAGRTTAVTGPPGKPPEEDRASKMSSRLSPARVEITTSGADRDSRAAPP